jgi:hypothetical protein
MKSRAITMLPVVQLLLAATAGMASEAPKLGDGPWTETFTMVLKDVDRTFVVHDGASFLATRPDDFDDRSFLLDKDLMIPAKFHGGQGERMMLYGLDDFDIRARPELWSTHVDGDNLYVFAHCSVDAESGKPVLRIASLEPAPSDAQLIAAKQKGIAKDDWDARLAVAAWAREQGAKQGNQEYWLQQADDVLTKIIGDAAAQAEANKDLTLALRAIDWAVDQQKDPIRAARLASAPWIRAHGGKEAEEVSRRMHRLGMELYRDQWRPRPEALGLEFEDRFAALPWKDADGFYKLGRWADASAETLPQAKDRAYRAYQAGFKANPDHPGIRRELGLDVSGTESLIENGQIRLEFHDATTGISVRSPIGWRRGESQREGVRWEDPTSETAYITERFIELSGVKTSELWDTITASTRKLPGFTVITEEAPERKGGDQRVLRYSFAEDRLIRYAAVVFIADEASGLAVVIESSYIEEEKEKELKALDEVVERVAFPKPAAEDKDKGGKSDKSGKAGKSEQPEKSDKPNKAEKPATGDKPAKFGADVEAPAEKPKADAAR